MDPMTFDELSAVYRAESKSQMLSDVRKDIYDAITKLQESIKKEYEHAISEDPDSIIGEGLNERRKKASFLAQKVTDLRMEKIAKMALRASMGAENSTDKFTKEETDYYQIIVTASKKLRSASVRNGKAYTVPDISPDIDKKEQFSETTEEGEEFIESSADGMEDDTVVIRILEDLPKIAGPDRDYMLKKEDVVKMPTELANALIQHEKAVLLDVTP